MVQHPAVSLDGFMTDEATDVFPPRLTKDELKEFILGVCDGRIFTDWVMPPHDKQQLLPVVFMPIALGGLEGHTTDELNNVGAIWEYMNQAGPRSINGYPMFMSMHLVHRLDTAIAMPAIMEEKKRRDALEVELG